MGTVIVLVLTLFFKIYLMSVYKDTIGSAYASKPDLWLSFGFEFTFDTAGTATDFNKEKSIGFEIISLVIFLLLFFYYRT